MLTQNRRVALYIRETGDFDFEQAFAEMKKYAEDRNWQIAGEYRESGANKTANPYGLAVLFSEIESKKFDTVLIYRLDHLGENLIAAKNNLRLIKNKKLGLVSLMDGISTIDQGGLVFSYFERMLKAVKRLESRQKQSEIRSGIERAKDRGAKLGRPEVPEKIIKRALKLRTENFSFREIGRLLDYDESTIRKKIGKLRN